MAGVAALASASDLTGLVDNLAHVPGGSIFAAYVITAYSQIRTYRAPLGQPSPYSLTWNNVLGDSGGWVWVVVNCTVASSYGVWVHVYRPWWGSMLTMNL